MLRRLPALLALLFALPALVSAQDAPAAPPAASPPPAPVAAPPPSPAPGPAAATPAAEAKNDEAMARARAHMEKGQALYMKGLYADAAAEFERAFGVQPFAAFLFNAGVAFERQGDLGKAIEKFEGYLAAAAGADDKAKVEARIADLKAKLAAGQTGPVGAAESKDMKSLLVVRSNPAGAKVTVVRDGAAVAQGESPLAESLNEGRYQVTVEHPDYRTAQTDVDLTAGGVFVYMLEMSQGQFLGALEVVSDVPGADVYIDDKAKGVAGQTPFRTQLPVGPHKVWIEKSGYREVESTVELELGREVRFRADLTRVDFGRLRVVANVRGAEVQVDGKKIGNAPGVFDLPSGSHKVVVMADDMKDYEISVDVRRGKETPLRVRLRPSVSRTGAWITGTLAVAALAGGITLGVLSNAERDDIESDAKAGKLASDDSRTGGIFDGSGGAIMALSADVCFGAAAILGGLSIYYFVRDPLPDSEGVTQEPRDWAVAPFVAPSAAGVSMGGSF